jgi:acetyl esterase/lipase
MVHYYFTSPEVQRSLPYGRKVCVCGVHACAACRLLVPLLASRGPLNCCRLHVLYAHTPPPPSPQPRQRLDLYTPKGRHRSPAAAAGAAAVRAWPAQGGAAADADGSSSSDGGGGGRPLLPVVIFVTGGAWTIGYKAWGALLARRLCGAGVMVACLDYRNFPQGSAADMLEDVNTGIAWVLRKAERHGGDPDATFLVGQSAGGQLAMLAALTQAAQAASGQAAWGGAPVWHPRSLAGYVGVSE